MVFRIYYTYPPNQCSLSLDYPWVHTAQDLCFLASVSYDIHIFSSGLGVPKIGFH